MSLILDIPDYAVQLLASASLRPTQIQTGADLVAYWQSEGVVGTRSEIADSPAHARVLRERVSF